MRDIWIVFKKELREWLMVKESWRSSLLQALVFVGAFGVFWPLQLPVDKRDSAAITIAMLSLVIGNSVVADSFAGEKERKTLETLLATRLPDHAIFLGKMLADTCYTLATVLLTLLASIVAVNVIERPATIYLYSQLGMIAAVGGSVVLTLFGVGLGVFVSLRSATARAAQQTLIVAYLLTALIATVALPILPRLVSRSTLASVGHLCGQPSPAATLIGLLMLMLLFDIGMIGVLIRRFERTRLVSE